MPGPMGYNNPQDAAYIDSIIRANSRMMQPQQQQPSRFTNLIQGLVQAASSPQGYAPALPGGLIAALARIFQQQRQQQMPAASMNPVPTLGDATRYWEARKFMNQYAQPEQNRRP